MGKRLLGLTLGLVALLAAGSVKAAGFEGEVDYKMTTHDNKTMTMDYWVKGTKIRVNTQAEKHDGSMIMDLTAKQMVMLMPQQKMYMTMDIPDKKPGATGHDDGKFEKTGKTDTLLGKKVEEWLYTNNHGQTSIWVVAGMGSFMGMGNRPGDAKSAWAEMVKAKGLFPLKVVSTTKDGKGEMTMEATKIEEKSVDAGLFVPPADYKKMDMGGMFGGMMGKKPGM